MLNASFIEINLTAVANNIRLVRQIVGPSCLLCPIVKADAYGLGATRIAKTLLGAGAEMLAVYTPQQATELIQAAIGSPILVLMPVREIDRVDEIYRGLIRGKLHLCVHDEQHLNCLIAIAERFGANIPVHLEVDTGMSRGGCALQEAPAILRRIAAHSRLQLAGLFTHFANAEQDQAMTDQQMLAFDELIEQQADYIPASCLIHAANTFATLRTDRYHKSMVRIGLAWAGFGMESITSGEIIADGQHLQPAITWRSQLVQLRTIPKETSVGYGSRWTASRQSIIGLVPVGYADGYPAGAGQVDREKQRGIVAIEHQHQLHFAPVVGAVNMDQITVDLTDIVAKTGQLPIGTPVQLITPDATAPNHLPQLAEVAGTFTHEMMCRLNSRIKRTYYTTAHLEQASAPASGKSAAVPSS
jgi:alanine racemase